MRVGTHHWVPCLLNRRFLSILMSYWLGLLLSRVCRMGWAFQLFWICNFRKNLRSPAAKPFSIWGIPVCSKNFESCELVAILPRMKWLFQEIQPAWLQSGTFQLFFFQFCIAIALEDYPSVPGEVCNIIGCDSNIIHVLSTLVSFYNWVQVLAHEAREKQTQFCWDFVQVFCRQRFC